MKFDWQYRYVNGGTKPDKQGRWALDLSILVKIDKSLKDYKALNATFGKYMPTRVATIELNKKETANKNKFSVMMLIAEQHDIYQRIFYSNDLDELKKTVESEFTNLKNFFKNCR